MLCTSVSMCFELPHAWARTRIFYFVGRKQNERHTHKYAGCESNSKKWYLWGQERKFVGKIISKIVGMKKIGIQKYNCCFLCRKGFCENIYKYNWEDTIIWCTVILFKKVLKNSTYSKFVPQFEVWYLHRHNRMQMCALVEIYVFIRMHEAYTFMFACVWLVFAHNPVHESYAVVLRCLRVAMNKDLCISRTSASRISTFVPHNVSDML